MRKLIEICFISADCMQLICLSINIFSSRGRLLSIENNASISRSILPNYWLCVHGFQEWFRYMGEFMLRYNKSTPKFLLAFHSLLSHNNINLVQVADADTAEHLRKLHKSGAFDNALVIVMADHGHRFAQFRGTHQGLCLLLSFWTLCVLKKPSSCS